MGQASDAFTASHLSTISIWPRPIRRIILSRLIPDMRYYCRLRLYPDSNFSICAAYSRVSTICFEQKGPDRTPLVAAGHSGYHVWIGMCPAADDHSQQSAGCRRFRRRSGDRQDARLLRLHLLRHAEDSVNQGWLRNVNSQADVLPTVVRDSAAGLHQRKPLAV